MSVKAVRDSRMEGKKKITLDSSFIFRFYEYFIVKKELPWLVEIIVLS